MYNYSLVYVLVDDSRLLYYNMMMKSVLSVRLHMPDICINVLVDTETESYLKSANAELYDYAKVIATDIQKECSQVERSRYLKTNARKLVKGDFLFLDSDTVICRPFPDVISDKSFAIAFDQNASFDMLQTPYNCWVNEQVGLQDVSNLKYYFNSGIIWVKDDEYAHSIYREWYELWERTHTADQFFDQPSLNFILQKEIDNPRFGMLGNEWNVQIGGSCNSGIGYLLDAFIIHYMRVRDCAFLLCQREYFDLSYKDEMTQKIIKDPRRAFGIGKLLSHKPMPWSVYKMHMTEDKTRKDIEKTLQYKLLRRLFLHKKLFSMNERILRLFVSAKRLLR